VFVCSLLGFDTVHDFSAKLPKSQGNKEWDFESFAYQKGQGASSGRPKRKTSRPKRLAAAKPAKKAKPTRTTGRSRTSVSYVEANEDEFYSSDSQEVYEEEQQSQDNGDLIEKLLAIRYVNKDGKVVGKDDDFIKEELLVSRPLSGSSLTASMQQVKWQERGYIHTEWWDVDVVVTWKNGKGHVRRFRNKLEGAQLFYQSVHLISLGSRCVRHG
jgi:hypothetical protein